MSHPPATNRPPARPPLMNEFEAAELLRLDVTTMRRYRWLRSKSKRPIGPRYLKFGRLIRYDLNDLVAFIASARVEGSETAD